MYRIHSIGGCCPTQAEGEYQVGDERGWFYFRARGGSWTLTLGDSPTAAIDLFGGARLASEGFDSTYGFMPIGTVRSILDAALGTEQEGGTVTLRGE